MKVNVRIKKIDILSALGLLFWWTVLTVSSGATIFQPSLLNKSINFNKISDFKSFSE